MNSGFIKETPGEISRVIHFLFANIYFNLILNFSIVLTKFSIIKKVCFGGCGGRKG